MKKEMEGADAEGGTEAGDDAAAALEGLNTGATEEGGEKEKEGEKE